MIGYQLTRSLPHLTSTTWIYHERYCSYLSWNHQKLKETLLAHLALLLICFLSLAVELVVLADEEEVCS